MPSFPGRLAGLLSHRPAGQLCSCLGLCLGRRGVRTSGAGCAELRDSETGPLGCRGGTEGLHGPGDTVLSSSGRPMQREKAERASGLARFVGGPCFERG